MPTSDTGIPYPAGSAAPAAAADIMLLAQYLDEHTVLYASDEADRDALWGTLPAPVVVVSKARPAIWLKVSDTNTSADWRTVWSDPGQQSSGFAAGTNFSIVSSWARKVGIFVDCYLIVTANADFGPTNSSGVHAGNLAGDPVMVTIPTAYAPPVVTPVLLSSSFGSWGGRVQPSGNVMIYDGPPGATLSDGDFVTMRASWLKYEV